MLPGCPSTLFNTPFTTCLLTPTTNSLRPPPPPLLPTHPALQLHFDVKPANVAVLPCPGGGPPHITLLDMGAATHIAALHTPQRSSLYPVVSMEHMDVALITLQPGEVGAHASGGAEAASSCGSVMFGDLMAILTSSDTCFMCTLSSGAVCWACSGGYFARCIVRTSAQSALKGSSATHFQSSQCCVGTNKVWHKHMHAGPSHPPS